MEAVVILQARTSSRRLPGKALLPVAEYPSAILAALRAGNRGHTTGLATSDSSSDDALCDEARKCNVNIFRGPMDDVLGRFYLATVSLPEDCAVVRLTADNVVPDGELVLELVKAFRSSGAEYLDIDPIVARVPYGVSAEIFTVAVLRKAHWNAKLLNDREHVGPWMKRNCRAAIFKPELRPSENYGHLRCTIDEEADYRLIVELFKDIPDPVNISWLDLTRKLATLPGQPQFRVPYQLVSGNIQSKFVLGTAQLGMEYGRVNGTGQPSTRDAVAIVRRAIGNGVSSLDTARCYGDSENILGVALEGSWRSRVQVITKLDLSTLGASSSNSQVRASVDTSIDQSCRALRTARLDTLLLHDWAHHDSCGGRVWRCLLDGHADGKITTLGASVYQPWEAIAALDDPVIKHLQIPVNVLDRRWKTAFVKAIAQRTDVTVHARSVLLQGILLHSEERWPFIESFNGAECVRKIKELVKKFERRNLADLCVAYVRSLPWVTSLVLGCETLHQLDHNLELFLQPTLNAEQVEELEKSLPSAPEELLNPSRWKSRSELSAAYAS